jgi:hypothetical protein
MSLADAIIAEKNSEIFNLLRLGAPVNQLDEYGFTPLIEAAIADNQEIAELIISAGANVNLQDSTGGTALHWAAENNNINLAKLLLANHADPNAYNFAGQPVLVMPLLRQQQQMKKLLSMAGANLEFAQDYINAKLLGHMYELVGTADIVEPRNNFVELDFEGFYLEFSLSVIAESVAQFSNHYAARDLRRYMSLIHVIVDALDRAAQLIRYQQYRVDIKKVKNHIDALLPQEPLIIPVGYEGHAITFVKWGTVLVKCDRREESRLYDNVVFYQMAHPDVFNTKFIKNLLYEKQSADFINDDLPQLLGLKPITTLKVPAQISGNCSWANVEACIPVIFFFLLMQIEGKEENMPQYKVTALNFFQQWREWNKNRTLQFCIQSFKQADSVRKACKAEILAAILFQSCQDGSTHSKQRVEMILKVLMLPQYKYVLHNYVKVYCYEERSETGQNFLELLRTYGYFDNP